MIAARRLRHNFALDRALEHCREFKTPLLILEALRCGYPWASDRIHQFVIDGIADNTEYCRERGIAYYPYLEPQPGAGKGLLEALAADACVVVTDDFPCFFLPRMVAAAAAKLAVRLEAVDCNGLLPLRATEQVFIRAFDFRRFLQKSLPAHLAAAPHPDPLASPSIPALSRLPETILKRWPAARAGAFSSAEALQSFPIDHTVQPSETRGGETAARRQLSHFFDQKLKDYGELRNEPELDVVSGLAPYLHFGHISIHEVFAELARREKWRPEKLSLRVNGSREGWWNMSSAAESFLDEIVTWREVGYNFASHRDDYDQFDSLPDWVKKSLQSHAADKRVHLYSLQQFESAGTHDPLWNAAQTQLVREGRIHNYLRMLWGKKILEWSKSPREAARIMIHLNNKYGLDGRNPNSYSGIFWVLGRYDRPWAPERPIFGVIRYMSSENTARKVSVKNYIRKYSPESSAQSALAF
jgi:deoxyribodipyrimidine photo-lyase